MKKSVGKKLLAGIVSASMILGIPVTGYSQEETQDIIALEEAADAAEAILAGAESVDVQIPQETAEAAAPEEVPVSEDEPTLEILDEMPLTEGDAVLEMAADEDMSWKLQPDRREWLILRKRSEMPSNRQRKEMLSS